jgi:serine phosphatase RsbU (regulator of sigma subunit)
LPKKIPEVKGLELGGRMKTALEVGGDYYDIIRSGDGRKVYLVIGDVSGKGVPAGLFMVQARTIIHALAARSLSPKEIITKTNRQIYRDMFDAENPMFITMVILCWDVETQELTYTGAGHEDILIYRGAKAACESVKTGGVFIGVMNNVDDVFQEKTLNLNSGDMILLYTDGVTDFRNPANELFGKERLTDFMAEKGELIPEKFIDRLYGELEYFGKGTAQYDDVTVIVLKKK